MEQVQIAGLIDLTCDFIFIVYVTSIIYAASRLYSSWEKKKLKNYGCSDGMEFIIFIGLAMLIFIGALFFPELHLKLYKIFIPEYWQKFYN